MAYGIRKGLEDIARELKGIKTILSSIWNSQYKPEDTNAVHPELYADEYISTEECAKRLDISDQTIRNWIAVGRTNPDKGWKEGIHYVNIMFDSSKKAIIRIPWNALVQTFASNRRLEVSDSFKRRPLYKHGKEEGLE